MELTPEQLAEWGVSPSFLPDALGDIPEAASGIPPARLARGAAGAALEAMGTGLVELHEAARSVAGTGQLETRNGRTHVTAGDIRVDRAGGSLRAHSGGEAELARAASARFNRIARLVDTKRAGVLDALADTQKAVDNVVREPHAQAAEIRAHLRGLKASERVPFIAKRIGAGDASALRATLTAPVYLAGFDDADEALTAIVAQGERAFAPEAAAARDFVQASLNHFERAARTFTTTWAEIVRPLGSADAAEHAMTTLARGGAA